MSLTITLYSNYGAGRPFILELPVDRTARNPYWTSLGRT